VGRANGQPNADQGGDIGETAKEQKQRTDSSRLRAEE